MKCVLANVARWLPSAVFLAITAYYIACHHVSPLSRDQWHMLHALLEQGVWHTSVTTVSGHRHLLAFLLYDIDLQWFGGRNHFLILVDWLLNGALIALLCREVFRCIPVPSVQRVIAGWIVVMLCWLLNIALNGWGFNGINNWMSIVNIALSVLWLHRAVHEAAHSRRHLCLSLATGALATLSFGNGILAWPIALLNLYLWRAPVFFWRWVAGGFVASLGLYLCLPGSGAVGEALRFNGWHTVLFPVGVAGAPLYHLLRAWHLLPEGWLMPLAGGFGTLVTVLAALLLWYRVQRRPVVDRLDALALALVLVGYGSLLMLTITRVEGVLDPAVDRFQIFALLVWLGTTLMLYRALKPAAQRRWLVAFGLFPLLALPSQLDWGARLAEYRTRVDNALLAYQVYLPVAEDAEKALHWNWQGKLPHLFPVLEYLREHQRNVFADGAAAWLGKPLPGAGELPACPWQARGREAILAGSLLDLTMVPGTEPYRLASDGKEQVVGWRWQMDIGEVDWDAGLLADASGTVRGLVHSVRHSHLPRSSGVWREEGNAYGVARVAQPGGTLVLLRQGQPVCRAALPE